MTDPEAPQNPEAEDPVYEGPSAEELIAACGDDLDEDDIAYMREEEIHDEDGFSPMNYVAGRLIEQGVEDIDAYFKEKGIGE